MIVVLAAIGAVVGIGVLLAISGAPGADVAVGVLVIVTWLIVAAGLTVALDRTAPCDDG